ncbi:hypothetical protein F8388_017297 [Cannabis sativa]|uniref:MYB transcription factor n=1 Tax=Cannabis sativa TaxID=3483 RepID=A0A7J6I406_CANSA|nr:hypothetical protein F8388_017297 [Cannabis sativa]KAF4402056.1 hypothetical protein G4B88_017568 [Cannabis sativa]
MGAPKQKWTAEEEAALKAGVIKHGAGKWRTILTDPEFSSILHLRSNVDLKDKWRNINVTAIWGSRQKAKLALKKNLPTPKLDNNPLALVTVVQNVEEVVDAKPLAIASGTMRNTNSKEPNARLDKLILDAITNLRELRGSDRAAIAMYIEVSVLIFSNLVSEASVVRVLRDGGEKGGALRFVPGTSWFFKEKYWAPPNLKKLLSTKLKHMTENGKLIKVKHRYRIGSSSTGAEKRRNSSVLPLEERPKDHSVAEKNVT